MNNAEMAETFTILGHYSECASVVPEHDELFIGHGINDQMSDVDRRRLVALGWSWDNDIEAWRRWF